jgi:hypothetical protein
MERDPEAASELRPFLPRTGESAEGYAARLRALHRDLTLMLEAVERGLSAPPEPPRRSSSGLAVAAEAPATGGARVEVMPPPPGHEPAWEAEQGDRRGQPPSAAAPHAAPAPVAAPPPAPVAAPPPPLQAAVAPPPPQPAPAPPAAWTPAPPHAAPAPPRRELAPYVVPAALAGWLTTLALALYLLLD